MLAGVPVIAVMAMMLAWAAQEAKPEMARVDADLGPCTVTFEVVDEAGKPLYAANIYGVVKHGFWNLKKTELELGTNSEGKAQFTGLPRKTKDALWFEVRHGGRMKKVVFDPRLTCDGRYAVILRPSDKEEKADD